MNVYLYINVIKGILLLRAGLDVSMFTSHTFCNITEYKNLYCVRRLYYCNVKELQFKLNNDDRNIYYIYCICN